MPTLNYNTLDECPAELREFAKPVEGQEGKVAVSVVPKKSIDEFRDNNIKLSKERDTLLAERDTLKGIVGEDADGFSKDLNELRQTAQRVKDGELKESRGIEEALSKRTEELRKDYDIRLQSEGKEKAAWRQKFEALDQNFKREKVVSAIKDAAMAHDSGVNPSAMSDITGRALGTFRCDEHGRIIPYEGDAPIYGSDGATPMSPKEWLQRLKETNDYLFKPTNGGGAGGLGGDTTKKIFGHSKEKLKDMRASDLLDLANTQAARKTAQ